MKAKCSDRITLVNLADAGYVMGLEKPVETANALLQHIRQYFIQKLINQS